MIDLPNKLPLRVDECKHEETEIKLSDQWKAPSDYPWKVQFIVCKRCGKALSSPGWVNIITLETESRN